MGDPESKRKRYCLMCNVFKPDRCHHCSACNRCVLNMDHHCPWVNNCIGFWNRKFFLLLLFYGLCTLYFYVITMAGAFIDTVYWHMQAYQQTIEIKQFLLVAQIDLTYLSSLFLSVVLTRFAYFHLTLVRNNMTTIESLEHKGTTYESLVLSPVLTIVKYDVGVSANWQQVFGRNALLWFIPIMGRSGKPDGSGVTWPLRHGGNSIMDNHVIPEVPFPL